LPLLDPVHIDGYLAVTDEEAIAAVRLLARREGILAGFSAGANLAAALQLLDGPCCENALQCRPRDTALQCEAHALTRPTTSSDGRD
jgi:cysteine synthase A